MMERSSLLLLLLLLPSPHLALLLSPLLPRCQILAALGDGEDVVQLVGFMGGAMGR